MTKAPVYVLSGLVVSMATLTIHMAAKIYRLEAELERCHAGMLNSPSICMSLNTSVNFS